MNDEVSALGRLWLWLCIGGLAIGLMIAVWAFILGPIFNQTDYNNFNSSPTHLNAVAGRFSDDCQQIAEATNATEKKAIENDIYQTASTVNLNDVSMPDYVRTCVNQAIQDVTKGQP